MCVVAFTIWVFPRGQQAPRSEITIAGGILSFDRVTLDSALSSKRHVPGYFKEELFDDQVAMLFGGKHPVAYSVEEALAGYDHVGRLVDFSIRYHTSNDTVSIFMGAGQSLNQPIVSKVSAIHGTEVSACYWYDVPERPEKLIYGAFFELEDRNFIVTAQVQDTLAAVLDAILGNEIVLSSLKPAVIPEWRDDILTLQEAKADADFGAYVPTVIPAGFKFSNAHRQTSRLSLNYYAGMRYIEISIAEATAKDHARIVDISKTETYDLSLYPIPRANSVPEELWQIVNNPVFMFDELSEEILWTRAYKVDDTGDDNTGYRMQFSVLYENTVISLNIKGTEPEHVLRMLQSALGND